MNRERTAKGGKGRTGSERNRTYNGTEHERGGGQNGQGKERQRENSKRRIRTDQIGKERTDKGTEGGGDRQRKGRQKENSRTQVRRKQEQR